MRVAQQFMQALYAGIAHREQLAQVDAGIGQEEAGNGGVPLLDRPPEGRLKELHTRAGVSNHARELSQSTPALPPASARSRQHGGRRAGIARRAHGRLQQPRAEPSVQPAEVEKGAQQVQTHR